MKDEFSSIGDVVKILKGSKAPEVFDKPRPGAYPYLQIEDLRPDATPKYAIDKDGTLAAKTDVLIAWDGANAGTIGFDLEGYIGSTIAILRPIRNDIHAPYLGYFLRSKFKDIQENTTGATIPHVSRDYLETLKLPLPPLSEQKRIASLLARADRLRSLRRTARALGESLLQSVFLEMFGEEQKQNYVTIQELMDSEVIVDMQDGNHGGDYPRTSEFVSEGIPFLTATNVIGNRVFLDDAPRLKPERAYKLRIGWVKPNDVLLSHNATVGRVAIMPNFEGEVVLGTSLTYYRLNPEVLLPRYFSGILQSKHFQSQLESFMGQTTRNQVPITRQRELFIPVPPPLSKQEEFAGVVARVEGLRGRMSESERQAEELFESLLALSFVVGLAENFG